VIFGRKKKVEVQPIEIVKPVKTIESLLYQRLELEKKIELINEDILKLQIECPHEDYSDYDKIDGTGYTVCNKCFAELARLY
jgi:hypothetical protein